MSAGMRIQIERQLAHWTGAIDRLSGWESWASEGAWRSLEYYLGVTLRRNFEDSLDRLRRKTAVTKAMLTGAQSDAQLEQVRRQLLALRGDFVRVETMLDFFGDAINTRTSAQMAALLRACDILAERSMQRVLEQFGKPTPPALTYLDKGLGASILKAGLRLWDGTTINSVSTIKIVRHNLVRPTSLIHEAGHQVAHQLDWNNQLAAALADGIETPSLAMASTWSDWASEIAADVFAFVHTGYASVAALHDVLAGEELTVFALRPGDPHPAAFVRVLLGVEMCRQCYGKGAWDDLAQAWISTHKIEHAPAESRELMAQSLPLLPQIAHICLRKPLKAFRGKTIVQCLDPNRVSPSSLMALAAEAGDSLYRSSHWVQRECLRITALTGYRSAVSPRESVDQWNKQKQMMLMLGAGQTAEIAQVA
jgi:hypothetical protein